MPLPESVAVLNRRFTNRLTGSVADRLPGFAILIHTGRRSGTGYRTLVNVFAPWRRLPVRADLRRRFAVGTQRAGRR